MVLVADDNKKFVQAHIFECKNQWQLCNQCYYHVQVKTTSKLIEKSVIIDNIEKRGNKVIALSKTKLRSQDITYTFVDNNWMQRQGGGYFELPYISIVNYNDFSF